MHTKEARMDSFCRVLHFTEHDATCVISSLESGEATPDGGYRQKFDGIWYEASPVDRTPKCDCGLDAAIDDLKAKLEQIT